MSIKSTLPDSAAPLTADMIEFGALSRAQLDDERLVVSTLVERAGVFSLTAASIIEDVVHAVETLDEMMSEAQLDGPRRETARVRVLQHCRAVGIKDARTLIDSVLKQKPPEKTKPETASVTLTDDEPADEPVDGADLLAGTSALIRRHVVMRPSLADAIALWVGAAYAIEALSLMPFLLVTAATMRAGKTTLLTVLGAILPRALAASNLTGAVLARAIAAFRPTLIADEADTWLTNEASELRGIMNAGHTRPTAFVLRCAPETHEPTLISCFCARVIAMIRRPPSTIGDRSIVIELRRKRADERVERLRVDRLHGDQLQLRRRWRRWALDHLAELQGLDPAMPLGLNDRAADNWRPLVAIADLVGGNWPARARAAALEIAAAEETVDESLSIELLRDIRGVFDDKDTETVTSADLTTALAALSDRPWSELSAGKPITKFRLAGRLKPFGIRTRKVRQGLSTINAYLKADFLDAWSRYLPSDSEQSEQANESGLKSQVVNSEQKSNVPSGKSAISSMFTESVPTVPSQTTREVRRV